MNSEILNATMKIEVNDYQRQRENVTRHILSKNIKCVSVCDHLYRGTKEYGIVIITRDWGMNMERVQDQYLKQGPRYEDGKIQEGWENTKRIGRYWGFINNCSLKFFFQEFPTEPYINRNTLLRRTGYLPWITLNCFQ